MNKWNIPDWLELEVRARVTHCIYCGVELELTIPKGQSRRNLANWEHIINDASIATRENIALCCSRNASKGAKDLSVWLCSAYCKRKNITVGSIAPIAHAAVSLKQVGNCTPPQRVLCYNFALRKLNTKSGSETQKCARRSTDCLLVRQPIIGKTIDVE